MAGRTSNRCTAISIHALLAESDKFEGINFWQSIISIHALLAESDQRAQGVDC